MVLGVEGLTDRRIEAHASQIFYVPMGGLGRVLEILKQSRIKSVLVGGGLPKAEIYNPDVRLDGAAQNLVAGVANRGDDHLLKALRILLKLKCGVDVLDSRPFLKEALVSKGVLTARQPTESEWQDLKFGFKVAKEIGRSDIGQTVVVKNKVVVAVEAVEGTDAAIRRGAELARGGVVVVKTAKPQQDMGFDIPCVGLNTLDSLKVAESGVLGVESGKTIMLDRKEFLKKADHDRVTVVGL